MKKCMLCLLMGGALSWSFAPAWADQPVGGHLAFNGQIAKIASGLLFVKTPYGLQLRTISPNKADRVGLHNAKIGDEVRLLVDSGNVLLDVAKADRAGFAEHRMVAGRIHYSDPYWGEIQLSTPEGFERFEVDSLAGSKLSVFSEGTPVTVELDGDNVMIDIYRRR